MSLVKQAHAIEEMAQHVTHAAVENDPALMLSTLRSLRASVDRAVGEAIEAAVLNGTPIVEVCDRLGVIR